MWCGCTHCAAARPRRSKPWCTGRKSSSRVVGRRIEQLDMPNGASIVALVRGERVVIAHHDTQIEPEDHVIMFLSDRRQIDAVQRLFQPA